MSPRKLREAIASADTAADEVAITAGAIGELIDDLRGDGLEFTIRAFGYEIPLAIGIRTATEADE